MQVLKPFGDLSSQLRTAKELCGLGALGNIEASLLSSPRSIVLSSTVGAYFTADSRDIAIQVTGDLS